MLVPAVAEAVEALRANYPSHVLTATEDADGGTVVIIQDIDVSAGCAPATTWIGFRITFQYPYADIYPHYVRPDLVRRDGAVLGSLVEFQGQKALQISRRSNHRDPALDTAVLKLQRVVQWLTALR